MFMQSCVKSGIPVTLLLLVIKTPAAAAAAAAAATYLLKVHWLVY
jgi:hypothetical protein